ncbi:MBL fold metallo-hydrolase [Amphritea japonica]|uniref:Beta-lactamase domain-containing protein n=1 Tax=Amphritea japonica ATCC BAA-1530 TaxID=1278309 RepID=A0A7R6PHP9_9GAMM|nr:MBL fold metallo-hydrolase [Amphritea japonica]BBB24680.1 beta-lactamase domain-containing protein [Amphritea japonica ATCC BAA-1530]
MKTLIKKLCVILATLLWIQTAQAANKLTQLSENAYVFLGTEDYSANNSYGANAGIIIGDKSVLVIDTQISSLRAQEFIQAIREITDKPIRYVLNTHFHSDHTFGNADFSALGATIISHHMADVYMKKWSQKILDNGWSGLTSDQAQGTRITYPDMTFQDKLVIDLGGIKPEIIFHTHSHTQGSVFVHLPKQQIVFAGDVLFNDYHPNMSASDVAGWVKTLDLISALNAKTIVPGHGELSVNKDLTELRSYLLFFDEKAKQFAEMSDDRKEVQLKLLKVLPHRAHGESAINSSLKWKYMRKPASASKTQK